MNIKANIKSTPIFHFWECSAKVFYDRMGSIMVCMGETPKEAFLSNFHVLKQARGWGIGTALLDTALAWCKANGFTLARLEPYSDCNQQEKLENWYRKKGFNPTCDSNFWIKTL